MTSESPIVALMSQLRASVRASRIARGENPDAQPTPMFPRTREDYEGAEAERRAEIRRSGE